MGTTDMKKSAIGILLLALCACDGGDRYTAEPMYDRPVAPPPAEIGRSDAIVVTASRTASPEEPAPDEATPMLAYEYTTEVQLPAA